MIQEEIKKGIDCVGVTIVFFCHDGKGNFVMAKRGANTRDEHGRWDPGGGGLELHDTVEETLRREIREEYCTDVLSYDFLGYRDVHRVHNEKKTHWVALDFAVLIDPKKVANGEPGKFEEVAWFTLDSLPKDSSHSQFPFFLEKYKTQLRQILHV